VSATWLIWHSGNGRLSQLDFFDATHPGLACDMAARTFGSYWAMQVDLHDPLVGDAERVAARERYVARSAS